jgi:ABC-type multidrug transport system ATPase subunit
MSAVNKKEKPFSNHDGPLTGRAKIDNVIVDGKHKKTILRPMSIQFPEGQVTAILGPSGSGKSTLLDFLTGSVSGGAIAKGEVDLPGESAYVPQSDSLHGFYTCDGYMKHYARLSGSEVTHELENEIDVLFDSLGLTTHKNTIVGDIFLRGLSGGQKRRLSVALEALTRPLNFFLDEPTSGLDSDSALRLVKFLKKYAREAPGRRVIFTIHQPSSFILEELDNIILLSGGQLMYQGGTSQMESFFESHGFPTPPNYNPMDHYIALVNSDFSYGAGSNKLSPSEWATAFTVWQSSQPSVEHDGSMNENIPVSVGIKRGSTMTAIIELTRRYFKNLVLNPGILGTRLVMYAMLGLIIGALFFDLGDLTTYTAVQSRIALSFYCVAFFIFMSVAVLPFTVIERDIVEKEVRNAYYHPVVYQVAQAFASIPGAALLALETTVIIVSMTGLRAPFWYFINMFLSLVCAEALAQLVSHIVPHFIIGIGLVSGFYGLFMLLQGFMLVPSEFPTWLRWSYDCAFHTYAWRSFMYSEFHDQFFPDAVQQGFGEGNDVLKIYEIESVNRTNDMLSLVVYALVLHLLSFAVLLYKHHSSKKQNASVKKREMTIDRVENPKA